MNKIFNGHISDLSFAKEKTFKDLQKNKNRRLSALFRDIKKYSSVDGIGNWPIMSMIVQEASKVRELGKKEIWNLCHQSKEYKNFYFGDKKRFTKTLVESINY